MTRTYATLEVTQSTFAEIHQKLTLAEYDQAFHQEDGVTVIDMQGIALKEIRSCTFERLQEFFRADSRTHVIAGDDAFIHEVINRCLK